MQLIVLQILFDHQLAHTFHINVFPTARSKSFAFLSGRSAPGDDTSKNNCAESDRFHQAFHLIVRLRHRIDRYQFQLVNQ